MLTYKQFLLENKLKGYVYITHDDNNKFFKQKAKTWRDGFEKKLISIKLVPDPSETYDEGQYGIAKLYGASVYVTNVGGRDEWEIEGKVKE